TGDRDRAVLALVVDDQDLVGPALQRAQGTLDAALFVASEDAGGDRGIEPGHVLLPRPGSATVPVPRSFRLCCCLGAPRGFLVPPPGRWHAASARPAPHTLRSGWRALASAGGRASPPGGRCRPAERFLPPPGCRRRRRS